MILLIDNYDSFVFNLARYCAELGFETRVARNDCITLGEIGSLNPSAIILSPGPCTPAEAGISTSLVRAFAGTYPIFGVCLGFQSIAASLGAHIVRAAEPVHGRTSWIGHSGERLFDGLPNPLRATRYHSLVVDEKTLPSELEITARTDDGTVMALEHCEWPLFGVQFHPESILTQGGHRLLANVLRLSGLSVPALPKDELAVSTEVGEWTSDELLRNPPLHW